MDQTTTTKSLTRVQADDIFKIGLEFYEEQAKKSNLSREFLDEIPRFSLQELIEGKVLGTGGFCSVSEVRGLRLIDEDIGDESVEQESFELGGEAEVDPGDMESRQFIANHSCRNNGDARYAIKKLKQQIIDDQESFLNGMVDLATETDFLSVMDHPNIIRLRGIAKEDMFSSNYFLILDRLYDTLESRIPKWRQRKHAISGIFACFSDKSGKKKEKMKEERMEAGLDLAAAISYFHQNKIIHRDLKSENIGFDVVNMTSWDFLALYYIVCTVHLIFDCFFIPAR
jgi:serine/threonine protein kinase